MRASSPRTRRIVLGFGLGLLLLVLIFGGGTACGTAEIRASSAQPRVCGRMLFQRHCMSCHGAGGLGDGPGAAVLDPKPRDFSLGTFRLVSTDNGVPTDADLYDVITRGIVGSAMPPHDHLSVRERQALVGYVRSMTRSRRADLLQASAQERGGAPLTRADALKEATETPGAPIELPASLPRTPELLAEGRALYVASCAACHDLDGTGRTRHDMLDDKGRPVFARDFTAGVLKGGSDLEDIHRRIRCGMPGSPMPALDIPPREALALALYVESLIPTGAQAQLLQRHTTFTPQRVDDPLSADPAAPIWKTVEADWVALAPLQWTDHRVDGFMLQVARDESLLGIRLVWEDSTPQASGENISPDTAAIRLSPLTVPQFFCPGRTGETKEFWQWDADAGEKQHAASGVEMRGRHHAGSYEVVFLRDLAANPERVGMSPDGVSLAFEIRNGAAGNPDNSQNITVWHRLESSL